MIAAAYYDGRSSRRQEARLSLEAGRLRLEGAFGVRAEALADVDIAEPSRGAPRTIRFADGASCEVENGAALDAALLAAGWRHSAVVALQGRWRWALAALAGTLAVAAVLYVWALPWVAAALAPRLPDSFARVVSQQALDSLDARFLKPSALSPARQQQLSAALDTLSGSAPMPAHRLLFRAAPVVGPNAFALPNGDLVLFDELVALAKDDREIVAVLAHELGHVHYRHGMRQLIQGTVVSFVAGIWFGDVSSLAAGLGALVLESRYSRAFESQADAYAAELLTASGSSPEFLAVMLGRLDEAHGKRHGAKGDSDGNVAGLLSSHPDSAARIADIRRFAVRPR